MKQPCIERTARQRPLTRLLGSRGKNTLVLWNINRNKIGTFRVRCRGLQLGKSVVYLTMVVPTTVCSEFPTASWKKHEATLLPEHIPDKPARLRLQAEAVCGRMPIPPFASSRPLSMTLTREVPLRPNQSALLFVDVQNSAPPVTAENSRGSRNPKSKPNTAGISASWNPAWCRTCNSCRPPSGSPGWK